MAPRESYPPTPYEEVYQFVLTCSNEYELKEFTQQILAELYEYVSYDVGTIYYYDSNGKLKSRYTTHDSSTSKRWFNEYQQYYSKIYNSQNNYKGFSESSPLLKDSPVQLKDWIHAPVDEFKNEYILPRSICYTLIFFLFDLFGSVVATFMLDRTSDRPYTEQEIRFIETAWPLLNNLNKNISGRAGSKIRKTAKMEILEECGLTQRETEIAVLICKGFKPQTISSKTHISLSTTYKHIAHIYQKMQVSSRQELLVKVLGNDPTA